MAMLYRATKSSQIKYTVCLRNIYNKDIAKPTFLPSRDPEQDEVQVASAQAEQSIDLQTQNQLDSELSPCIVQVYLHQRYCKKTIRFRMEDSLLDRR